MSMKVENHVKEHSKLVRGAYWVLRTIATYCKDDGTGAWPSQITLANDTRISKRQVSRAIKKAEDEGELLVQSGAGPFGANLYEIIIPGLEKDKANRYSNGYNRRHTPIPTDPKVYLEEYAKWRTPLVV
jgi:hypothetical protein